MAADSYLEVIQFLRIQDSVVVRVAKLKYSLQRICARWLKYLSQIEVNFITKRHP